MFFANIDIDGSQFPKEKINYALANEKDFGDFRWIFQEIFVRFWRQTWLSDIDPCHVPTDTCLSDFKVSMHNIENLMSPKNETIKQFK